MKITEKEIQAVSALSASKRYTHFIKKVADREEVWGLYDSGWTMLGDCEGTEAFPLWPAAEYAQACAKDMWEHASPTAIPLEDLLQEVLPQLQDEKISIGVFLVPSSTLNAVVVSAEQLAKDLATECLLYE